jgi:formate dehydrogenase iron-sulfur subunit
MMACPYGIPRYTWAEAIPYVRKCIMCYDGIKSGELDQPACTKACPSEATIYGDRDDLLAVAHKRIENRPDLYLPKVFGENEVGGASVLYISDISLGFLGLTEDLDERPLPLRTQAVLDTVPGLFVGVGVVMGGVYWVIDRRMRLQAEALGDVRISKELKSTSESEAEEEEAEEQ